eukprot:scaffold2827_cov54-Phaeocystis_antarctica.AAC.3
MVLTLTLAVQCSPRRAWPYYHGAHSYDYRGYAPPGAHGHTTMVLTLTTTVAMLTQARLVPLPAALVLLLRDAVLPHATRAPVEVGH